MVRFITYSSNQDFRFQHYLAGYGKVPEIPGAAPRKIHMTNRTPQLAQAKTVKIRYGPYSVPNSTRKNDFGEMGSLYNYPDTGVERPCEGECVMLGITAGLEYANGSDANVVNGMWLHHVRYLLSFPPLCLRTPPLIPPASHRWWHSQLATTAKTPPAWAKCHCQAWPLAQTPLTPNDSSQLAMREVMLNSILLGSRINSWATIFILMIRSRSWWI